VYGETAAAQKIEDLVSYPAQRIRSLVHFIVAPLYSGGRAKTLMTKLSTYRLKSLDGQKRQLGPGRPTFVLSIQ
jgi:hypothetical protein